MTWRVVSLGDLCSLITKGTTPTTLGYEFVDEGVAFLRVQNVDNGTVNFQKDTLFIDNQTHHALRRSQIEPGDVLVSIAGTIGRSAVVPANAPPLNCNQALAILRPTNQILRPFLQHWLNSENAKAQIRGASVTGTISNLSLTQIGNLNIDLPPLPEQKRIAQILDAADTLRVKRRAALAQVEELTQAIFLEMFGDPATNPMGWPLKSLGDILEIPLRNGLSPSHSGTVVAKVLTLSAVTRGEFDPEAVKTSTFAATPPPDQAVCRSDLLICRGNGNINMVGLGRFAPTDMPDTTFPDTIIAARVKTSLVVPAFLELLWNSVAVRTQIESLARTTNGTFKVNQTMLEGIRFVLPPLSSQQKFGRRVAAAKKLKAAHRRSLAELDALFAALQHRAFRGEL